MDLATRLTGEKKRPRDVEVSEAAREAASVRGHVGAYLSQREAREGQGVRPNARQRLGAHVLGDAIADLEVVALTAADIRAWRSRLLKTTRNGYERTERMSPATEKRLLADFKAALGQSLTDEARKALAPQAGSGSVARELPYWSPAEIVQVTTAQRARWTRTSGTWCWCWRRREPGSRRRGG